jgi:hypothetical protein
MNAELAEWTNRLYRLGSGSTKFKELRRLYELLDQLPEAEQAAWRRAHGDQIRRVSVTYNFRAET